MSSAITDQFLSDEQRRRGLNNFAGPFANALDHYNRFGGMSFVPERIIRPVILCYKQR